MAVLLRLTLQLALGPAMTQRYDAANIGKSERQKPPDGYLFDSSGSGRTIVQWAGRTKGFLGLGDEALGIFYRFPRRLNC
jgi:hypothetical protein